VFGAGVWFGFDFGFGLVWFGLVWFGLGGWGVIVFLKQTNVVFF
jgi:hypothetical protein